MSRGINKTILVGHLGQDPEIRYTPAGTCVTTISLATGEIWTDKNNQKQERTEWHRVVFWNRLAEVAGEYLKKGSQVYVEGMLRTNKWKDNKGIDRYTTEIIANEMQMLGGKPTGTKSKPPANNSQPSPSNPPTNFEDFDDEIPF